MAWGVSKIRKVLRSLAPRNDEELHLLGTLLGLAGSVVDRASDLAVAAAVEWERTSGELPRSYSFPEVFNSVPEDVKDEFYRLVEAVQVLRSIRTPDSEVSQLIATPESLGEVRRIRDLMPSSFRTRY